MTPYLHCSCSNTVHLFYHLFQGICNLVSFLDPKKPRTDDAIINAFNHTIQQFLPNSSSSTRNITLWPSSLNVSSVLEVLDGVFGTIVTVFKCIDHEYFVGYQDEESLVERAINTSELPAIASKCMLEQF